MIMEDLEVMNVMAKRNSKGIKLSTDATNYTSGKKNGTVTMMIDSEVAQSIMQDVAFGRPAKLQPLLFIIDMDEYRSLKDLDYDTVMKEIKQTKTP